MKISALIPAYNEERTIGKIVSILVARDDIDKVLVVDDGSTDNTKEIAEEAGADVMKYSHNHGKGAAIQAGIDSLVTDAILLLDGDLVGLNDEHISKLLNPVTKKDADMSVGIFKKGRILSDLAQKITPNLSGQRVIKSEILEDLAEIEDVGYGVEMILNRHVKNKGKVEFVELSDLTHIMKEEKRGLLKGVAARTEMYWDILKTLF